MKSIAIIFSIKMIHIVINENSKNFDVSGKQSESLADYVLRVVREQDISLRKIEERAQRKGHKIAQSYLSRIISSAATNISVERLRALAAGLNRPEEEVFAVARGEQLEENKLNDALMNAMAFNYQKLTKRDKDAVAPLLRALQREIDERLEKAAKD